MTSPRSDQSVRDEIESRIRKAISYGQGIERNRDLSSQQQADWIQEQVTLAVASPAIRRIQAEAWSEGFKAGRGADHNSDWWPKNPYRTEK